MSDLWIDVEEKVEGKTILTFSANEVGMIIRFTDGSVLSYINGKMQYDESNM